MEKKGYSNPTHLTPMQKMILRFVVVGLVYYLFALVEGMLMRVYQVTPIAAIPPDQYFGMLNGTSASWNFWINLLNSFWCIFISCTIS